MANWDHTVEALVVGTGGGGMTAALVAKQAGLDVLLVEKSEYYGGSTALSGGGLWVPNNYLLQRDGLEDSPEKARTYLQHTVGNRTSQALQDAYIENAPEMVKYLASNSRVRFHRSKGYADYYAERPGGMADGRAIEGSPFNGAKLGEDFKQMRPTGLKIPAGMAFTASEYNKIGMIIPTWAGKWMALKIGVRTLFNMLMGIKLLALGQALVARLRLSLKDENIPIWLNTPLTDIVMENDVCVGVVVEKDGEPFRIRATKGVVLAAGGFDHNQTMREKYQKAPVHHEWSSGNPANTGDAIQLGMKIGAKTDLLDDAWWGPSSMTPDGSVMFHVGERSHPGGIIVNAAGKRFTNESASYVDVVHAMYEKHSAEVPHVPATFIMDDRSRKTYMFGSLFPLQPIPEEYFTSGYFKRGDTIEELAQQCGIDPKALAETIARFNQFARNGVDEDFHRGDGAYDRYYGDPTVKPNPCLAPLETPPFYAVTMVAGDLGTKGGLVMDEHARVLREDGSFIPGLYVAGNSSASVMGNSYPGAGSTIGPAMTFGYIAAKDIAGGKIRPVGKLP